MINFAKNDEFLTIIITVPFIGTFKYLGIPVGAILTLAKDINIKCKVIDVKYKVMYKSKKYSSSTLANTLLGGFNNGFERFKYKDMFLVDLHK